MTPKEKAYDLVGKVSYEAEHLPYSFCKNIAKAIVSEMIADMYDQDNNAFYQDVCKEIDNL